MNIAVQKSVGTTFAREWVIATIVGFAIVLTVGGGIFQGEVNEFIGGAIGGTIVGVRQFRFMRKNVPQLANWKWILGSTLGWIVGFAAGFLVGESIPGHSYVAGAGGGISGGIIGGSLSGVMQWFWVLRGKLPQFSAKWIAINTAGWALGFMVGFSILLGASLEGGFSYPISIAISVVAGILVGLIAGIFTGVGLHKLLMQNKVITPLDSSHIG